MPGSILTGGLILGAGSKTGSSIGSSILGGGLAKGINTAVTKGLTSILGASLGGVVASAIPYVGPILMGVDIARKMIGRGRKQASIFTSEAQDPFHKRLSQIIDPIDEARSGGKLTRDAAQAAFDQFNNEWAGFEEFAGQFKGLGGQQAKVVGQAYDPSGDFMKTVNAVRSRLEADLATLKPSSSAEAPTKKSILGTPAVKKRAAPQASRTLLGGTFGTARRAATSLLGY